MSTPHRNLLHNLTAIGAVLTGTLLVAGAFGHLQGVLPFIDGNSAASGAGTLALILPVLILAVPGALTIMLSKFLWDGKRWSLHLAMACNAVALTYLILLLWKGMPDHPVGMFLASVASYLVLLVVTRFGLVWPVINDSHSANTPSDGSQQSTSVGR